jgi:hypothetical protein
VTEQRREQEQRLEFAIESLAFLICGELEDKDKFAPIHRLPARMFDGFELLVSDDPDDFILSGDDPSDQPIWPLDVATAHLATDLTADPDDGWPVGSWQFQRHKTLRPSEWRGVLHRVYPRMIDSMCLTVRPNGESVGARVPYAIVGKKIIEAARTTGGWRKTSMAHEIIDPSWYGGDKGNRIADDFSGGFSMLGGLALRRRYNWSVLLGEGKGPRARFITDPVGIREIFRLRDIPPGRARRLALLHWVREHWRKRRDRSANDRTFVQKHLSGAWSYSWNGLQCQIEPSEEEVERLLAPKRDGKK